MRDRVTDTVIEGHRDRDRETEIANTLVCYYYSVSDGLGATAAF